MALVCRNARNLSTLGTLANARRHQTSLLSILECSKTLNCEKKPREASSSGCFGRGRSILEPRSKSDTGRLAGMHVQCSVVGRTSSVRWSQTSLNTP